MTYPMTLKVGWPNIIKSSNDNNEYRYFRMFHTVNFTSIMAQRRRFESERRPDFCPKGAPLVKLCSILHSYERVRQYYSHGLLGSKLLSESG